MTPGKPHTCFLSDNNKIIDCEACRDSLDIFIKGHARMKKWMMIRKAAVIFYFLSYILILSIIAHIDFVKGVLIFITGMFFNSIVNFFNNYTKRKIFEVL